MKEIFSNKRNIMILIVIAILIVFSIGLLVGRNLSTKEKENTETFVLTGTIANVFGNNLLVKENDTDTYYSVTIDENGYAVGDVIEVYTKDPIMESYPAQVKASKIIKTTYNNTENATDSDAVTDESTSDESSNSGTSSGNNDNSGTKTDPNGNSSNNPNIDTGATAPDSSVSSDTKPEDAKYTEDDVISYMTVLNTNFDSNNKSESFTKNLKTGFVTVIDFLFYSGEIKGYKFSELTNSAKLKVLKLALSIDSKIDKVFPGYKESISKTANKVYTGLKSKIVTTYLDLTTKVCASNADICAEAKRDFKDMKKAFGLTWNFILSLGMSGIENLSAWYLIWEGN